MSDADETLDGRRTPLAHRLSSLLSASSTPRSSSEYGEASAQAAADTPPEPNMRQLPFAFFTKAGTAQVAESSAMALRKESLTLERDAFVTLDSERRRRSPILRWFTDLPNDKLKNGKPQTRSQSDTLSRSLSKSSSPSSSPPITPPHASLAALREALDEALPQPPPPARLPRNFFSSSRSLRPPPPFFDNLTRSTLPTASLSPSRYASYSQVEVPSLTDPNELPPVVLNSPPRGSSIRSLRRLSLLEKERSSTLSEPAERTTPPTRPASPTGWWWFQSQNKEHVDSLLTEEDRADTLQEEQDNLHRKYRTPRNPIVFCHGLLGFDVVSLGPSIAPLQVTHWRGIKEVLEANGADVLITRVPATSSPADRAAVLEEKISQVYPGRSVHLIGHSMGGIDCRYLTTHLTKRNFHVLSVTTIASPHRGSAFANTFLSTVGRSRMPSVLSLLALLPNGGGDGTAFESLTPEAMAHFNEETPDVEGVKYFSWGAVYEPGLIDTWKWPHSVVLEKEGPNDGLVSVESAKWGTYLGTLEGVNHLDLVGWINVARYKWAEVVGRDIKFRPATFYLGIADMLAGEVEGQPKPSDSRHDGGSQGGTTDSQAGKGVELVEDKKSIPGPGVAEGSEDGMATTPATAKQDTAAGKGKDVDVSRARPEMSDDLVALSQADGSAPSKGDLLPLENGCSIPSVKPVDLMGGDKDAGPLVFLPLAPS